MTYHLPPKTQIEFQKRVIAKLQRDYSKKHLIRLEKDIEEAKSELELLEKKQANKKSSPLRLSSCGTCMLMWWTNNSVY